MKLLKAIPGIKCNEPEGAFYVFPDVREYYGRKNAAGETIANADDLCMYLMNDAHVSCVTGKAFGEPDCIRISFANNTKNIEEGFKRLKEGLAKLSK